MNYFVTFITILVLNTSANIIPPDCILISAAGSQKTNAALTDIYIDNKFYNKTDENGFKMLCGLIEGNHRITLLKKDYHLQNIIIDIRKEKSDILFFLPEKISFSDKSNSKNSSFFSTKQMLALSPRVLVIFVLLLSEFLLFVFLRKNTKAINITTDSVVINKDNLTSDNMTGQNLGRYYIEGRINSGGYSVIYKAEDTLTNKVVALKVPLFAKLVQNYNEMVECFLNEVNLRKKLFGPNHIKIFSLEKYIVEIESQKTIVPFYSMEFLNGVNLREVIRNKIPMKESQILEIINGVMNALKEAHLEKIYHKDIKPENIMISYPEQDNKLDFVKLLDFGVAKLEYLDFKSPFEKGIKGTVSYMSPEQIRNEKIGPETDYFSLGVVFYELLTYKKLFEGKDQKDVIKLITSDKKVDISHIPAHYSSQLVNIINKMLEKDRVNRYQDANEILNDLTELHF